MEKLTKKEYIENLKNAKSWKSLGSLHDTDKTLEDIIFLIYQRNFNFEMLKNNYNIHFVSEHATFLEYFINDGVETENTREYFKNSEYYRMFHNDIGYLIHVYKFKMLNGKENRRTYTIKVVDCK